MSPETVVDVFNQAFSLVILIVAAIALPGLIIGLVVAVFQAATSINEQTLSFLPRLIVTLLAMMLLGHWMFRMLMDFMLDLVQRIPQLVG